jgi:predicted RNA binding protein YcfA (HicA-like mRNA interferase family)
VKLPRVSGKQTVKALLRAGFIIHRTRGSHYILKHPETGHRVTIPYHRRELALKTLRSILKQAAVSPDAFSELV